MPWNKGHTKYVCKAGKLDARDYKWREWNRADRSGCFDFLTQEKLPVASHEVFFDEDTFELTDGMKNGVTMSVYGDGNVWEYGAMLLEDGNILFCVVSGSRFTDTNSSNDDIHMKYYMLTEIK